MQLYITSLKSRGILWFASCPLSLWICV